MRYTNQTTEKSDDKIVSKVVRLMQNSGSNQSLLKHRSTFTINESKSSNLLRSQDKVFNGKSETSDQNYYSKNQATEKQVN